MAYSWMELNEAQYQQIEHCLPKQRSNVRHRICSFSMRSCTWPSMGASGVVCPNTRMNRWSKSGVLDRIFEQLQHAQIVRIKIEAVSLDSTVIKVHPDGTGALKKTALKPSASLAGDGPPRFIWLPRMLERP